MKKLYTLLLLLLCSAKAFAADFYWVGGNGNWSDFQHHWALSSGGSVFQTTVPSAFDNVFFDANSFPGTNDTMVTINTAVATTRNITFNIGQKNIKIYFNNNTLIQIYGSAVFSDKLTLLNQARLFFKSASSGNQITFNKSQWVNTTLTFDGIGGSWEITDSMTAAQFIVLKNGELNTTGKNVSCQYFESNNSNNRTWKYSNARLTIHTIDINTNNLVQVYTTSSIRVSNLSNNGTNKFNIDTVYNHPSDLYGNHLTNVSIQTFIGKSTELDNSVATTIYSTNGGVTLDRSIVSKLYITNGAFTVQSGVSIVNEAYLTNISDIIIEGTFELQNFNLTGNTCAKRIQWRGEPGGILKKTSGTFIFEHALISNLTVSGGASFNTSNSYDLGGNSGINFAPVLSKTFYWVGDNGTINDPQHWSLTSGGAPDGCIPTVYDDVIFDRNSFNSGAAHSFSQVNCRTINAVDLDEQVNVTNIIVTGSAYLSPLIRIYETINFSSALTGNEIDLNGATIKGENTEILFNGTGDWTFLDSLYASSIRQNGGTIYANGKNIHAGGLSQIEGEADFSHCLITIETGIGTNTAIFNDSKIIFPRGGEFGCTQRVPVVISNSGILNIVSSNVGKLTSHGDLNLHHSLRIDTLIIKQGSNAFFYVDYAMELQVDSIGILPSELGCGRLTIFQTKEGDSYAAIKKTSGTLILKNTALTSIHAIGGANFIADECADLGNNAGWTFNAIPPKTYYWINNGGQWEDPAHWSLSSGGTSAGCIPSLQDKVVLDDQSFNQPNQLISKIKPEVQLAGFIARNIPPGTALAINKFEIYGDVEFTSNLHTTFCSLYLKGKKSTLKTNGKFFTEINTTTDSLELLDNLSCYALNAIRGFVKLKGHQLSTEGIAFDAHNQDTLIIDMEECDIYSKNIFIRLDKLNIKSEKSNITLSVGHAGDFTILRVTSSDFSSPPLKLNKVTIYQNTAMPILPFVELTLENTTLEELQVDSLSMSVMLNMNGGEIKNLYMKPNCTLTSTAKIGVAQFYGNVQFYGTSHIDYLRLEPGTQLSIRSGDSIIVQEYLDALGNSAFPITIDALTNGNRAFIKCLSGDICCSYLNLSNIEATGGATFYAGFSSNNIYNNAGWDFVSTCDLLAINAKNPGCEGKELDIITTHPPSITGFLWSGPDGFVSNSENVHISSLSYNNVGPYSLQAGGQTRKIFITQETKQDSVILNYNNSSIGFRSNKIDPAQGYTIYWYKDDQLLNESGNGFLSYGEGTYYARFTTPAGCDIQSNSVIVTNTTPADFLYAPYNLSGSLNSNGKTLLTWNDINAIESGFIIFRSTSPDNGFVSIGTIGSYTNSYTDPTVLSAGIYYYKVQAYMGSGANPLVSDFSNTISITVSVLSVKQTPGQNNISIRPIPVEDILTIESPDLVLTQITVYDQLGIIHANENIDRTSSLQLDLKNLPQGVYILKVMTTEGETYRRFMK